MIDGRYDIILMARHLNITRLKSQRAFSSGKFHLEEELHLKNAKEVVYYNLNVA